MKLHPWSKSSRNIGYRKNVNIHLNIQLLTKKAYLEAQSIHGADLAIECVYLFNRDVQIILLSQPTILDYIICSMFAMPAHIHVCKYLHGIVRNDSIISSRKNGFHSYLMNGIR